MRRLNDGIEVPLAFRVCVHDLIIRDVIARAMASEVVPHDLVLHLLVLVFFHFLLQLLLQSILRLGVNTSTIAAIINLVVHLRVVKHVVDGFVFRL